MSELKYIIVSAKKHRSNDVVMIPVLFGHYVSHKTMSLYMQLLYREDTCQAFETFDTVSAGLYSTENGSTYGESETLDMRARPEDADIIKNFRMDWSLA